MGTRYLLWPVSASRNLRAVGQHKVYEGLHSAFQEKTFLDAVARLFPVTVGEEGSVPLTYKWPAGTTLGTLVFNSADRPHLKWETSLGAPKAWKMSLSPSESTAETIPGDPTQIDFDAAENELAMLASRGAGQPYLMAIKLHDEPTTLHLRAYFEQPKLRICVGRTQHRAITRSGSRCPNIAKLSACMGNFR
mgnify:CR=1 FL=1